MTTASETVSRTERTGAAELAALVLLGGIPLVYFPGFTFEYTYLKLPLFQIVAIVGLAALVMRAASPGRWLTQRMLAACPAALLVGWMFASVAWHRYSWVAGDSLVRETTFLAGFVGLSFLLSAPGTRKLYARWLGGASVVAAAFMICFFKMGSPNYFGNRNFAGGFLVLPITAMLAFILGRSEKLPTRSYWSLAAGLFVMIYAFLLTASHAAFAGAVLGGLLACFVFFRGSRRYLVIVAVVGVVAAAGVVMLRPGLVRQALGIRALIWEGTLRLIGSAPLLGQGAGAFPAAIRPFLPVGYFAHPAAAAATQHAHSFPLEITAELGIGGLALYAALLVGLFLAARRAVRSAADGFDRTLLIGVACGLAGMVANGLAAVGPTYPDVQINFWLGAAFICGAMGPATGHAPRSRARRLPALVALAAAFAAAFYLLSWRGIAAQRCAAEAARQKRPAERLALLRRAKALQPYENRLSFNTRMKIAAACFPLNQLAAALAEYMEIESLSTNFGGIDASVARAYQLMGEYPAAADYAGRAARSNPFDPSIYAIWLDALRHGATEPSAGTAAELLMLAEKLKPFEQALRGLKTRIESRRSFDRPFFDYTACITRSIAYRAGFCKHAGRIDEAGRLYAAASAQCAALARCVRSDPGAALSLFNLWMRIGSESGDQAVFQQAAEALVSLLASAKPLPGRAGIELYYLVAALHYNSGEQEAAVRELKQVAAWCQKILRPGRPDDPWTLGLLARAYAILDPPLSLHIAERLLEQDPYNAIARHLIFKLKRLEPDAN